MNSLPEKEESGDTAPTVTVPFLTSVTSFPPYKDEDKLRSASICSATLHVFLEDGGVDVSSRKTSGWLKQLLACFITFGSKPHPFFSW